MKQWIAIYLYIYNGLVVPRRWMRGAIGNLGYGVITTKQAAPGARHHVVSLLDLGGDDALLSHDR